jgi:hypothetical protein
MANTAKSAIMRAKIDGVLTDLMLKTTGGMVYLDDTTTLAAKLSEMIAAINARAKSADVTKEISDAVTTAKTDIKADYTSAISKAIADLIDGAPETYDTLKEIADYINSDASAMGILEDAIAKKANTEDLGALAKLDKVTGDVLDKSLQNKIDEAADSSHSHANKDVLDGITSTKVTNWDAAASAKHSHSNKTVLDGITSTKTSNWDAAASAKHAHANKTVLDGISADDVTAWNGKSTIYYSTTQPDGLQEGDLWVQLVD